MSKSADVGSYFQRSRRRDSDSMSSQSLRPRNHSTRPGAARPAPARPGVSLRPTTNAGELMAASAILLLCRFTHETVSNGRPCVMNTCIEPERGPGGLDHTPPNTDSPPLEPVPSCR